MKITTVVFDVGKVLFEWDLRYLFAKLIADKDELEFFVTHVVTPEWHFQHDAGRPLADMVPERKARFPQYAALIALVRVLQDAYPAITAQRIAVDDVDQLPNGVLTIANHIRRIATGGGDQFVTHHQ